MIDLATEIHDRCARLEMKRAPWNSLWSEISRYVMPRKADTTRLALAGAQAQAHASPGTGDESFLFDSTAIRANNILANGQLTWMTPHESRWFKFAAPGPTDDEGKNWYEHCTEIAQVQLANSNFYSEIHELYLDRGGYGTAVIQVEPGQRAPLTFSNWDVGTYALEDDDEGLVDVCYRRFTRTARQLAQRYGFETLPAEVRVCLNDRVRQDEPWEVIHAIYPRPPQDIVPGSLAPWHMPVASCHVLVKGVQLLQESGYWEIPFGATRFLKWGQSPYGWSPSWMALPDARQLNFLEKQMDALAEIQAFPRLLIPSGYEFDDVDLRANGKTYFNPAEPNAVPREWLSGGKYDIGLDRANRKRESIEKAFHVDLFMMFASLEKQMTATEVAERHSEKMIQFSPTFARMTTELFTPVLRRVFMLLLRQGLFPEPPESVIVMDDSGGFIPDPKIEYTSRIALALNAAQNASFSRTIERMAPVAQLRPDVLDNYNWDQISRDVARNDGLPPDWLMPEEARDQIREERAQMQARQQQLEEAQMAAAAAKDAGSVPAESPIAGMLGAA